MPWAKGLRRNNNPFKPSKTGFFTIYGAAGLSEASLTSYSRVKSKAMGTNKAKALVVGVGGVLISSSESLDLFHSQEDIKEMRRFVRRLAASVQTQTGLPALGSLGWEFIRKNKKKSILWRFEDFLFAMNSLQRPLVARLRSYLICWRLERAL